mgnify:CR=1 FL=1|tara:strand:- start:1225 stop:1680 length:456 start_codon:yes stop_codon:yes gene_type:complete
MNMSFRILSQAANPSRIFLFAFIILFQLPYSSVSSHTLTEIHIICKSAKDYQKCISYHTDNKNNFTGFITPYSRTYGPITIDWSNWRTRLDDHVVPVINEQGKNFYLAVNCIHSKINITGKSQNWLGWESPNQKFEYDLLNDYCSALNDPN